MKYDDLSALLRKNGSSLTKPRKVVFDLLFGAEPQTMQQLVAKAQGKIDRASVYRAVELFEQLGITHRLSIGFKYKIELSDVFTGHHHHFYCTGCSKMHDLAANSMLETMIDSLAAKQSYAPRGHSLEIYGLCKNCQRY